MQFRALLRMGTVLAVGVIAAVQSYSHIYHLALAHGQDHLDLALMPLSVDGLIIAASLTLAHGWPRGPADVAQARALQDQQQWASRATCPPDG
jgi:Protein of unknown function (DUF2637)